MFSFISSSLYHKLVFLVLWYARFVYNRSYVGKNKLGGQLLCKSRYMVIADKRTTRQINQQELPVEDSYMADKLLHFPFSS